MAGNRREGLRRHRRPGHQPDVDQERRQIGDDDDKNVDSVDNKVVKSDIADNLDDDDDDGKVDIDDENDDDDDDEESPVSMLLPEVCRSLHYERAEVLLRFSDVDLQVFHLQRVQGQRQQLPIGRCLQGQVRRKAGLQRCPKGHLFFAPQ